MASFQQLKRRSIVPLAVIALTVYYVAVLLPLSRRAEALNVQVQPAWQKLASALDQTNATAIDFLHITNQLAETRRSIALLDSARQKAVARLDLGNAVRSKLNTEFQLFDYNSERSKKMEEIAKAAGQSQVAIEPSVLTGFPTGTADIKQPEFLWAALALVDSLLSTAIQCKVGAIHNLEVPLTISNRIGTLSAPFALTEIPLQVELTGPSASVLKFLQDLPLRTDEAKAAGLAEAHPDKAPLFVDRLIIKKQNPEKTDEVRLVLRAVGFVLRD